MVDTSLSSRRLETEQRVLNEAYRGGIYILTS